MFAVSDTLAAMHLLRFEAGAAGGDVRAGIAGPA